MRRLFALILLGVSGTVAVEAADAVSPPQYGVAMSEAWITLPDGVRLAADIYRPEGAAADDRFPVLLEYLPYRKTEARSSSRALYSYFVQRGYVVARVDIRGTGNSEGRLVPYEYSDQEHIDGETVIAWLASQPWSNGNVAMFGISWGGFNAIQMAMRNPPALKAIVAVDATEDLYQEDVHFMDGILHLDSWEMSMDLAARPGAPDFVIDEAYFRDRFEAEPWMLTYKRHQREGPFWDRASAKGRYEKIRIPTFHIGGWYDGYRDSLPRMLEHLRSPVKAMIGPWSHAWPHDATPQPGMEWRHEAARWFDQFLKGKDTGILEEPRFAVYMRQWHPPGPTLEHVPGYWRWEEGWPLKNAQRRLFYPQPDHALAASASRRTEHLLRVLPSIGIEAGGPVMWWGDAAHDQRPTDAFSLVYDSAPLEQDVEILGFPAARLNVAADQPHANWMARLSDVAPDGTVTQVTGAAFNGTHRQSARDPRPLKPGEYFPLDIEMHFTSWVFPKGHRIRFAVNNSMWPMLWPTKYAPMTTRLVLGGADGSRFELPVVSASRRAAPKFLEPAEDPPPLPGYTSLDSGSTSGYGEISSVNRNPQTGEVTVLATNTGAEKYPWGTEKYRETIEHRTSDAHPEKTSVVGTHRIETTLRDRVLLWEAELSFTSDLNNFHYKYTRRLSQDGRKVREKTWTETIPRDYQ